MKTREDTSKSFVELGTKVVCRTTSTLGSHPHLSRLRFQRLTVGLSFRKLRTNAIWTRRRPFGGPSIRERKNALTNLRQRSPREVTLLLLLLL